MAALQIGWIDFSKEQRNKVMSVISLLSEPEAVDELGIGLIRDGYANIFFPGTSTIQTRAKYFLLTPYLLYELEKEGLKPDELIERLHKEELAMISQLEKGGEAGIIGKRSKLDLIRKPSDIYWNGIQAYGIFNGTKVSINEYAKAAYQSMAKKYEALSLGKQKTADSEVECDDLDACVSDIAGGFWKLPVSLPKDWKDNVTIQLTHEEAVFIKKCILRKFPNTLLGETLENSRTQLKETQAFENIEAYIGEYSADTQNYYLHAKDFANFIEGVFIRYNMMLSKGQNDYVQDEWKRWSSQMHRFCSMDLEMVFADLEIGSRHHGLLKFLRDCRNAMEANNIPELDRIIVAREVDSKDFKRAKLKNVEDYQYMGWVGLHRLDYRLKNVKVLLMDIFAGLERADAEI